CVCGGWGDNDGSLSFRPQHPPEDRASLRFPITYRGQLLDVEISPDSTTYSLREGAGMVIRHEGEVISLDRANPSAVRPTLKPLKLAGSCGDRSWNADGTIQWRFSCAAIELRYEPPALQRCLIIVCSLPGAFSAALFVTLTLHLLVLDIAAREGNLCTSRKTRRTS